MPPSNCDDPMPNVGSTFMARITPWLIFGDFVLCFGQIMYQQIFHDDTFLCSPRAPIRIKPAEDLCETKRKVFETVLPAPVGVIPRTNIVSAHYSIPPGACSRSALRTYLIHIRAPIPFVPLPAHCATGRRSQGTIRQRRIFGIGDASPDADDAWAAHLALKPAEEAPSSRSKTATVGSRRQHPLPDRPPTLRASQSVLSRAQPVSTHSFLGSRSYFRRHGVQFRRAKI